MTKTTSLHPETGRRMSHSSLAKTRTANRRRVTIGGIRTTIREHIRQGRSAALYGILDRTYSTDPSGSIYALFNTESYPGMIKLGCSKVPERRQMAANTFDPHKSWHLILSLPVSDQLAAEKMVHDALSLHHIGGEFFDVTPERAIEELRRAYEQYPSRGHRDRRSTGHGDENPPDIDPVPGRRNGKLPRAHSS